MKRFWHVRELSTVVILILEIAFFGWYLWPEAGRSHPFLNLENALLILKYSSIYGIAAVGAAVVIISGGIDLAPGSIIALASVICGVLFVDSAWPLEIAMAAAQLPSMNGVTVLATAKIRLQRSCSALPRAP